MGLKALTVADKLNILTWSFVLFSVVIVFAAAVYGKKRNKFPFLLKCGFILVLLGGLSLVDAYWIEPNWIKTEEVVIHDTALAKVLGGVTVVQISDIHFQGKNGYRERSLLAKVNALKPDVLFITGDFFSDHQKQDLPAEVEGLTKLIRGFKTTSGIFGIAGNYDGPFRCEPIVRQFKDAGVDILFDEARVVALPGGKRLYLVGLNDMWDRGIEPDKIFKRIPHDEPAVMLVHYPEHFGEAMRCGANLVLAGHTHGGQVGIPFLIRMSHSANKTPYISGLYDAGSTKLYVNRGIGTTNTPLRFLCRPEITVIKVTAGTV